MSQNLRHALYHYWLWKKEFLLSSFALSSACSLYYHFFPIRHVLIDAGVILASVIYLFSGFMKDLFSWKFYQALPLTKRELYHYLILIQFFVFAPFLVWYFCFPDVVHEIFFEQKFSTQGVLIALGGHLIIPIFMGIASFYGYFESIRSPYVKRNTLYFYLQLLRDCIYGAYGALFLGVPLIIILANFPVAPAAGIFVIPLMILGALYFYYSHVFKRWNNEELSYFKKNFRPWRDGPLMTAGALPFVFMISIGENQIPKMYGDQENSELIRAIHKKDKEKFSALIRDKKLLHGVSDKGWTPLMVAAHAGSLVFFLDLIKEGAALTGQVNSPKELFHHRFDLFMLAVDGKNLEIVKHLVTDKNAKSSNGEFTALHLAAYHCSPEIIDVLLEKGADVNALNSHKETPLHVAAGKGCFSGVVSLVDHGADPLIKDKNGKIALEQIKGHGQLAYYLEKKGRRPAGK